MISSTISSKTLLRMILVMVVCFSTLGIALVDNIVQFYTGNFGLTGGEGYIPGATGVGTEGDYISGTLGLTFAFSGPITNFQETAWCGYGCPQYFTGNVDSGTVTFYGYDDSGQHPAYDFNGYIHLAASHFRRCTWRDPGAVCQQQVIARWTPGNSCDAMA